MSDTIPFAQRDSRHNGAHNQHSAPKAPARERITPQSLEAEQSSLGACLMAQDAIVRAKILLKAADFYREIHRKIFRAIMALYDAGEPVDLITVVEALRQRGELEEIGGTAYLTALIEACPSSANIDSYARTVAEKSELRELLKAGEEISGMVYAGEMDAQTIRHLSEKRVFDIGAGRGLSNGTLVADTLSAVYRSILLSYQDKRPITGLPSGFPAFDEATMGWQPEELYVIGAPPGAGKTIFTCNVAAHLALRLKKRVLFFTFEMSREQLVRRIIAAETGIPERDLRRGYLSGQQLEAVMRLIELLENCEFILVDQPCSPSQMLSLARRFTAERGHIDLIIVDYIHIVPPDDPKEMESSQLGSTTKSLKQMAKFLQTSVIAISATSNEAAKREGGSPQMHDARGGSGIQYNTDTMIMLKPAPNRDYPEDDEEQGVVTQFWFVKNRFGQQGARVDLRFQGRMTRFVNIATEQQEQSAAANGYVGHNAGYSGISANHFSR